MTCVNDNQAIDYLSGELSSQDEERVNRHITRCESCLQRMDEMRQIFDALAPLQQFTREAVSQLELLGPFGQGNPKPVFATKGVRLASAPRRVGAKGDHLQFAITDNTGSVRCVGFRMGHLEKKMLEKDCFDVAYEAQINHYNGNSNVEFIATDVQFE